MTSPLQNRSVRDILTESLDEHMEDRKMRGHVNVDDIDTDSNDSYAVIGASADASQNELQQAFQCTIQTITSSSPEGQFKFLCQLVTSAYMHIRTPELREEYDLTLAADKEECTVVALRKLRVLEIWKTVTSSSIDEVRKVGEVAPVNVSDTENARELMRRDVQLFNRKGDLVAAVRRHIPSANVFALCKAVVYSVPNGKPFAFAKDADGRGVFVHETNFERGHERRNLSVGDVLEYTHTSDYECRTSSPPHSGHKRARSSPLRWPAAQNVRTYKNKPTYCSHSATFSSFTTLGLLKAVGGEVNGSIDAAIDFDNTSESINVDDSFVFTFRELV